MKIINPGLISKILKIFIITLLIYSINGNIISAQEQLDFGVSKSASINSANDVHTYSFKANSGDTIIIKMIKASGSIWPKITLYPPVGSITKSAYDSSRSEILTELPASGTYSIIAENGYQPTYTGDYTIFAQRINNPGNGNPLQFGVTKSASIKSTNDIHTYSFNANSGDTVIIKMIKGSGSIWPKITLYSQDGKIVKSAYESSRSEILSELPVSGIYTIIAENGYQPTYTGDYTIFAQSVNNPGNVNSLQFGVTKSASINSPDDIHTYSFNANSGDTINIKMIKASGSIWPKITLYSPSGKIVKSAYESSRSEILAELPDTGTYSIIAENGYMAAYTGEYTIFLQRTNSGGVSEPTTTVSPENAQVLNDSENTEVIDKIQSQITNNNITINSILPFIFLLLIAVFIGVWYGNKKKTENNKRQEITDPPPLSTKHDVFISYSTEDKKIADATCANLESRRIRCWIAPRDVTPGKNFQGEIIDAIENSRIMVLIFSSNSNTSPYIIRELTEAVEKGVIIIPFRIEDVLPSKEMRFLINVPHWLDAMSPPLEQHLEKLANTIKQFLNNET